MRECIAWVLVFLMAGLTGCGPDVDLILANGQSEESDNQSDEGIEAAEIGSAETDTEAASVEETDMVCAYICGAVEAPGVYEAEDGVRVYTLVEMAGGMTNEADEDAVNLARAVIDGEMIYIPTEEETASGEVMSESSGFAAAGGGSSSAAGSTDASGKININTASAEELTALSGIGESKAAAIVSYRDEHGLFASTEEITNVSGIGDSTYEKIKNDITV